MCIRDSIGPPLPPQRDTAAGAARIVARSPPAWRLQLGAAALAARPSGLAGPPPSSLAPSTTACSSGVAGER
eukprot:11757398-Alexandrium_andersonii.AAC.1